MFRLPRLHNLYKSRLHYNSELLKHSTQTSYKNKNKVKTKQIRVCKTLVNFSGNVIKQINTLC